MNFTKPSLIASNQDQITFIKADHVYVRIHYKDGSSYLHRESLSSLMNQLDSKLFFQVHRSYAINLFAMTQYGGKEVVVGNQSVPVSFRRWPLLMKRLKVLS